MPVAHRAWKRPPYRAQATLPSVHGRSRLGRSDQPGLAALSYMPGLPLTSCLALHKPLPIRLPFPKARAWGQQFLGPFQLHRAPQSPNHPSSPGSRESALLTHVQKQQLDPKHFVGLSKLVRMLSTFQTSPSSYLIVFLITKEAHAYCKNIHAHGGQKKREITHNAGFFQSVMAGMGSTYYLLHFST